MAESPPAFTIRPASTHDAASLTTLRGALFRELGQNPSPERRAAFEDVSTAAFSDGLERGFCFAWLAVAGTTPVGSVALLVFPRLPSLDVLGRQEGYLLSVYTLPPWRGLGIATGLVDAAVAKARALGLARIRLHATPDGQRIYAAAGFAQRLDEMELRL